MLTLFSVPKPFRGHIGRIQTNALQTWIRLELPCEIILFGDEEGIAETASHLGVKHAPHVTCNEYGTPLLNDVFDRAQAIAKHNLLGYVNADILLLGDFSRSVEAVAGLKCSFLMLGERWDVDLGGSIDFSRRDWEEPLRRSVRDHGRPRPPDWIDYFVFPKGLYRSVPPFAVGRTSFDNWLVWNARACGARVVDASACIMAIHQNHEYSHHPEGKKGVFDGPEAKMNRRLMGGRRRYFTIADATHKLTASGLRRNLSSQSVLRKCRFAARSVRDWRHRHGLHRSGIESNVQRVLGIQRKPKPGKKGKRPYERPYEADMHHLAEDGPLVSVVIPCRNVGHYLPQAIESVLQQDYPRLECIVMDGASTDDTQEMLRRYDGRIRWLSEPDRGPQDAINKGWKLCGGDILAWLNADDVWEPGAVSRAVSYFLEHPEVDVVYGDCGLIGPAGEYLTTMRVADWDLMHAVEYCDHIIHQAASFMRRNILQRVGWLYPKLCHDHELWLRISLAGGQLHRIPGILAHARDRAENLGYRSEEVVPLKVGLTEEFFKNPGLPPEFAKIRQRALSNAYLACIQYVLKDSLSKQELKQRITRLVLQAISKDPSNFLRAMNRLRKARKRLSRRFSNKENTAGATEIKRRGRRNPF